MKRAVCVLIEHPLAGLVLCVSRGENLLDWGLPGGKVEAGETLLEAAIRELREETAICLNASQLYFVRERTCKGETDYNCSCFRTTDRQLAHYIYEMKCHRSSSEGTVAWRKWSDLVSPNASFREYNLDLLIKLREMDHVANA